MDTSKTKKYWDTFAKTGRVEDYLQYKMALKKDNNHETNHKESRSYHKI